MEKYLDTDFNFDSKIINFVNKCSKEIEIEFETLKEIEEYNQLKVLNAFKKQKLSATDFSWTTDHSEHTEKWYCCIGAELLSIEPWNTGTDGFAGCEDRLGQRPKPSESLLELISAIFKVHQSLFL